MRSLQFYKSIYKFIAIREIVVTFGDSGSLTIICRSHKIEPDFEVGEEVSEQIFIDDFGRRAVTTARQTLIQKVKDLEKDILFQKYKDIVGEIISGEVYQVLSREVLLTDAEGKKFRYPGMNKFKRIGTGRVKMCGRSFTKLKW